MVLALPFMACPPLEIDEYFSLDVAPVLTLWSAAAALPTRPWREETGRTSGGGPPSPPDPPPLRGLGNLHTRSPSSACRCHLVPPVCRALQSESRRNTNLTADLPRALKAAPVSLRSVP